MVIVFIKTVKLFWLRPYRFQNNKIILAIVKILSYFLIWSFLGFLYCFWICLGITRYSKQVVRAMWQTILQSLNNQIQLTVCLQVFILDLQKSFTCLFNNLLNYINLYNSLKRCVHVPLNKKQTIFFNKAIDISPPLQGSKLSLWTCNIYIYIYIYIYI
jgi:hypothetical protein